MGSNTRMAYFAQGRNSEKKEEMKVTLETKFNIGDEVYYIKRGKICCAQVCHLHATFIKGEKEYSDTTYRLKSPMGEATYLEDFMESRLFATKEELLKHIGRNE